MQLIWFDKCTRMAWKYKNKRNKQIQIQILQTPFTSINNTVHKHKQSETVFQPYRCSLLMLKKLYQTLYFDKKKSEQNHIYNIYQQIKVSQKSSNGSSKLNVVEMLLLIYVTILGAFNFYSGRCLMTLWVMCACVNLSCVGPLNSTKRKGLCNRRGEDVRFDVCRAK